MAQLVNLQGQRLQNAVAGMEALMAAYRNACKRLDNVCLAIMPDQYDLDTTDFFRRAYPRLIGNDMRLNGIAIHFDRALQRHELVKIPAKLALIHNSQSLGVAAVHIMSFPKLNKLKVA